MARSEAERRMRAWVAADDGADEWTLRQWELELDEWWGSGAYAPRRGRLVALAAGVALAATVALYAAVRRWR